MEQIVFVLLDIPESMELVLQMLHQDQLDHQTHQVLQVLQAHQAHQAHQVLQEAVFQ